MQNVDLSFQGVSNALPDDLSPNGQLSMGFGLTTEGVVSTPVLPSATQLYGIDDGEIIFVHAGTTFKNVIVYFSTDDIRIYRIEDLIVPNAAAEPLATVKATGRPTSVAQVGNLLTLTMPGTSIFLYRNGDSYDVKNANLPPITFELTAACRNTAQLSYGDDEQEYAWADGAAGMPDGMWPVSFLSTYEGFSTDDLVRQGETQDRRNENEMEQKIMAVFTKMTADWSRHGYLFSPVIIRAAYRLKTGALAGLTNPVLCFPFKEPMMAAAEVGDDGRWIFRAIGYKAFARIVSCASTDTYADIIDAIEFYMSAPISVLSPDGTGIRWQEYTDDAFCGFAGFFSNGDTTGRNDIKKLITLGSVDALSYSELETVSTFYLVRSIPFRAEEFNQREEDLYEPDNLSQFTDYAREIYFDKVGDVGLLGYRKLLTTTDDGDMDVNADSIVTLPAMSDTLRSNAGRIPDKFFSYNSRLIAVGDTIDVARQPDPSFFSTCRRLCGITSVSDTPYALGASIQTPVAVGNDSSSGDEFYFLFPMEQGSTHFPIYLTCEETNVRQVICLANKNGNNYIATLSFKQHDFLSLAYFAGTVRYEKADVGSDALQKYLDLLDRLRGGQLNHTISRPDLIRASDVADPYTFDDANTVWFNSPVRTLLVTPEAISLGQYGTSQLYAICRDGVYTVDVDAEGKLSSVHTYTNDIISHTERATVMSSQMLVGSDIAWEVYTGQKKTTLLDLARNFAFRFDLPFLAGLPAAREWAHLLTGDTLFRFLRTATLSYDAADEQIVATAPDAPFIAVWRKGFGLHLIPSTGARPIQSNHLILVNDDSHILYDFSEASLADTATGFFVTRPIHLADDPRNGYVTLRKVILRGVFDRGKVALILYATRDFTHWTCIASSSSYFINNISGTPYKAFRIVGFATLRRDDYISHISLVYDGKATRNVHF